MLIYYNEIKNREDIRLVNFSFYQMQILIASWTCCLVLIFTSCKFFEDGWENRWVKSEWKKDENMAGEWNYTSGKWNGDRNDKGNLFVL